MIVYFDSSALVKLLVTEDGSDLASFLWDECDAAVMSRLGYVEVCAALAAALRAHRLDEADYDRAKTLWMSYSGSIQWVELSSQISRHAAALVDLRPLKGADAVHLASGLALGADDTLFAAWDQRLWAAARDEGLHVVPNGID